MNDNELPGMWEQADFTGGETDYYPQGEPIANTAQRITEFEKALANESPMTPDEVAQVRAARLLTKEETNRETIEKIVQWIADELRIDSGDVDGDGDEASIIISYLDQIRDDSWSRGYSTAFTPPK